MQKLSAIKSMSMSMSGRGQIPHSRALRQSGVPLAQHPFGRFPAEASVGDRDAVAQIGWNFCNGLVALPQIAFHHRANQSAVTRHALFDEAAPDILLPGVLFA